MIVLLLAVLTAAGPDSLASPAAADSIPPVTRVVADSLRGASRPASDSVALVLPEVRVVEILPPAQTDQVGHRFEPGRLVRLVQLRQG